MAEAQADGAGRAGWAVPGERRVVIVTGSSAGLGRATAVRLGRFGWAVALGARRVERLDEAAAEVRAAGGEAFARRLDVTDAASVDAFVDAVEDTLGPVDALVNNAAVGWPGPIHAVTAERLRATVETNLLGPLFTTRRVASAMVERGKGGDLVFVTSEAAERPLPHLVPYACTKAGVELLAKGLDEELAGTGIRVSTVRLGPSVSEWNLSWTEDEIMSAMEVWRELGIMRSFDYLDPRDVAEAIALTLAAPRGAKLNMVTLRPEVPRPGADPTDILGQGRDRVT